MRHTDALFLPFYWCTYAAANKVCWMLAVWCCCQVRLAAINLISQSLHDSRCITNPATCTGTGLWIICYFIAPAHGKLCRARHGMHLTIIVGILSVYLSVCLSVRFDIVSKLPVVEAFRRYSSRMIPNGFANYSDGVIIIGEHYQGEM